MPWPRRHAFEFFVLRGDPGQRNDSDQVGSVASHPYPDSGVLESGGVQGMPAFCWCGRRDVVQMSLQEPQQSDVLEIGRSDRERHVLQ